MVDIRNLSFGYQKNRLLFDNLNMHLPMGKIYGLLGKNGAGKTTLLKHIAGLLYPQKGECLVFEQPSCERLPEVLKDVFLIPEEFQLPAVKMDVFVKLHAPFYPSFDMVWFQKCLQEFEISNNAKLTSLSYGQKKKFLIAFGLATRTRLLIMDEPTNGLDIPSKSQFRRIIAASMTYERSIIISTHQVRDLSSLIDHVIILDCGRVVFHQSTLDISSKLAFIQTKEFDSLHVLHHEDVLGGHAVICRNNGRETEIDLELLFNGVVTNGEKMNNEFKN